MCAHLCIDVRLCVDVCVRVDVHVRADVHLCVAQKHAFIMVLPFVCVCVCTRLCLGLCAVTMRDLLELDVIDLSSPFLFSLLDINTHNRFFVNILPNTLLIDLSILRAPY
jgi:hypothetical protein